MGDAGVGYFYLRVLAPQEIPSILAPKIHAEVPRDNGMPSHSTINISLPSIRKKLAQKIFRRTIFVLEKLLPQVMANYFEKPASDDVKNGSFSVFLREQVLPMMAPRKREIVSDVFTLELEKWKMDQAILSNALLNIKTILHAEQAQSITELKTEAFQKLELVVDPDAKIIVTNWNWTSLAETDWLRNLEVEPGMHPVLLKPDPESRVVEKSLSPFSYIVLSCFLEKTRIESALQKILDAFDLVSHEEVAAVRKGAIYQIKEAFLGGILVLPR